MSKRRKKKIVIKTIGDLIDLPQEDFEHSIVEQEVNVGTISNFILNLESVYFELRGRKEAIIKLVFEGKYDAEDPKIKDSLNGLYTEMAKIEAKVTFLKKRRVDLLLSDKMC